MCQLNNIYAKKVNKNVDNNIYRNKYTLLVWQSFFIVHLIFFLFLSSVWLSLSSIYRVRCFSLSFSATEPVTISACDNLKLHSVCPAAHSSQITAGQAFIRNPARADVRPQCRKRRNSSDIKVWWGGGRPMSGHLIQIIAQLPSSPSLSFSL